MDQTRFYIQNIERREERYWLVELDIIAEPSTLLPELREKRLHVLVIELLTVNEVLHQLMNHLIYLSDSHVNEKFTYAKVARFSRKKSIKSIAMISAKTRFLHKQCAPLEFSQQWKQRNYETDLTRVPELKPSLLVEKIKKSLDRFAPLTGLYPNY